MKETERQREEKDRREREKSSKVLEAKREVNDVKKLKISL